MRTKNFLVTLALLVGWMLLGSGAGGATAAADDDLDATVAFVLKKVSESDCTFIRNGRSHSARQAAEHMRRKYEHFKSDIKTPDDFIRLAGTKSLKTGEDYRVKTRDGTVVTSAEWLREILKKHQAQRER